MPPEQDPAISGISTAGLTRDMRHDLLNPVNQIIGYAEMLQEEAQDAGAERLVPDLGKILTAARRLQQLVDLFAGLPPADTPARSPAAPAAAAELSKLQPVPSDLPPSVTGTIDPVPQASAAGTDDANRTASPPADAASTYPILVVDDDALNRDVLARRLQRQGHRVLLAPDGVTALEMLGGTPIDLVLLDVMMPGLDGYEVLREMKADPHLREVPVIMISGLTEIDSVVRCIEMGAEDYLPKPFNPVLLRARIGASLEKKHLRDQERNYYQALKESQERLSAELGEAAAYVRSLLPAPVAGGDILADWRFIPSMHLGGDAFGYSWVDADHMAVYLLDVCGHGVGAALLSVSVINVLRSQALPGTDFRDPARVLGGLNETFQMDAQNESYFTIWYGVYHRPTRRLVYSSGGHPPAVLVTGGNEAEMILLRTPGLMIGGFPDAEYRNAACDVPPGGRLFVFSDGVYEITRPDGRAFEFADFTALLAPPSRPDMPAVERIFLEIKQVSRADTFPDDFSLLELTFR
jgi:phosphoserine phosphatase RsbU/P